MHAPAQQVPDSLLLDLKTKSYWQLTETTRAFHVPRSDFSTASIKKEALKGLSFLYQALIVAWIIIKVFFPFIQSVPLIKSNWTHKRDQQKKITELSLSHNILFKNTNYVMRHQQYSNSCSHSKSLVLLSSININLKSSNLPNDTY